MRAAVPLVAISLVAISLWYLTAPPRDAGAYRERAARTVGTLDSQVRTAALWAGALADGKTLTTTARVGLEDAARRAEGASGRFRGYHPPAGADDVRARFADLAARVTDELDALEIAARRGRWDEIEAARPRLDALAADLARFREQLRR